MQPFRRDLIDIRLRLPASNCSDRTYFGPGLLGVYGANFDQRQLVQFNVSEAMPMDGATEAKVGPHFGEDTFCSRD